MVLPLSETASKSDQSSEVKATTGAGGSLPKTATSSTEKSKDALPGVTVGEQHSTGQIKEWVERAKVRASINAIIAGVWLVLWVIHLGFLGFSPSDQTLHPVLSFFLHSVLVIVAGAAVALGCFAFVDLCAGCSQALKNARLNVSVCLMLSFVAGLSAAWVELYFSFKQVPLIPVFDLVLQLSADVLFISLLVTIYRIFDRSFEFSDEVAKSADLSCTDIDPSGAKDVAPIVRVVELQKSDSGVQKAATKGAGVQLPLTIVTQTKSVALSQIRVGEYFQIKAGEFVLLDGEIVSGVAELSERKLLGGLYPAVKAAGAEVYAGSRLISGEIICRALSTSEDSFNSDFVAHLRKNVQNAEGRFAGISAADWKSFEQIFVFVVLFGAVCGAITWWSHREQILPVLRVLTAVPLIAVIALAPRFVLQLRRRLIISLSRRGAMLRDSSVIEKLASVKALAIDFLKDQPPGRARVVEYVHLDDRADANLLLSVFLSIWSGSDDELSILSREFIRAKVKDPQLFEARDVHFYPGQGICGEVKGADFSAGTEEFLVQRGVQVQANEIEAPAAEQYWLYLAMNDELVGKIRIVKGFGLEGADLVSPLHKGGLRVHLLSSTDTKELDPLAKRIGLDLSEVHGSLERKKIAEKAATLKPVAMLASSESNKELLDSSTASLAVFDEIRWDIARCDVTLFSARLALVPDVILACRSALSRTAGLYVQAVFFLSLLLVPAALIRVPSAFIALGATSALLLFAKISKQPE